MTGFEGKLMKSKAPQFHNALQNFSRNNDNNNNGNENNDNNNSNNNKQN